MKSFRQFFLLLILVSLTGLANASEIIIGSGVPYTARLVFKKSDINKVADSNDKNVTITSGDELLPENQANSTLTAKPIPTVLSNGWCDPTANPNTSTTDITQCYGRASQSQWFLLDLSKLGKRKVWAQISLQKDENSTDDTLVPALTVWQGQQNQGLIDDWYPNRFQGYDVKGKPDNSVSKAFWAWNLTPLNNSPDNESWVTASNSDNPDKVTVTQRVKLKGGNSNYLTVIVASDNQENQNKNANYKLLVRLSRKKPTLIPGDTGLPPPPKTDIYGCNIGLTCWHPQMNHCMAVNLCNDPKYLGECLCPN